MKSRIIFTLYRVLLWLFVFTVTMIISYAGGQDTPVNHILAIFSEPSQTEQSANSAEFDLFFVIHLSLEHAVSQNDMIRHGAHMTSP